MPRYYRRRYTRVVKPKKKWASNIYPLSTESISIGNWQYIDKTTLVENSIQSGAPTPVILKAGNFKTQLDFTYILNGSSSLEISAFIIYIPEGTEPTTYSDAQILVQRHPEWIMAWKYASMDYATSNVSSGTETINFSTRMKRNLNSGDKVMLLIMACTSSSNVNITAFRMGGLSQYWTCAN